MIKLSKIKVGISNKFKVRGDIFKRGVVYTAREIILKVQINGWFYEGNTYEENKRMVRSAIYEGILTGRIRSISRGRYIFL